MKVTSEKGRHQKGRQRAYHGIKVLKSIKITIFRLYLVKKCDQADKDIGIKFHKFKMSKNFNIPEIDDVVLNDYCSGDFLKANFVSSGS